jgi:hypothetical protein
MSDWDPVVLFSIILVTGALVSAGYLVLRQVRATAHEVEQVGRQNAVLSRALRNLATESLRLRHVLAEESAREARLREECEIAERSIEEMRRRAAPLVVFDERKAAGDGLWQVPVARGAAAAPAPWRTYLVWAPSADRARRRVLMRHAEAQGFLVGEPVERADFPAPAA